MSLYVGVDLGTTNSVVSYKGKNFDFVQDESGNTLVPSVVCYSEQGDAQFCGRDAVENEENFPKHTIRSSKRFIGQNTKSLLSLSKDIYAVDVAKDILAYLKSLAELHFNEAIEGIVITVPAYFNQNQRHETKLAAENAGLNVLRIINEPTAAALAYGDNAKKNELVLIYDLGGGTFDVTLLQLTNDNVYQVLSTSGDTKLGGDDFDHCIVEEFKKSLPENLVVFKDFDVRLKHFAEEIKKQLNYKQTVNKTLKYCGVINGKIYHHFFTINQCDYKEKIKPYLVKTKSHVLNALNDANTKISSLDKIILVGGSTKSIFVRDFVKNNFNTQVYYDIDPDLTVAAGAATLAKSLAEKSDSDAVLIDVTPLSLGIEIKGGLFNKIIPRNTNIPTNALQEFITSEDGQTIVTIKVYQGEKPIARDNELLGEFMLSGFPSRPKGQTKIVVRFDIDTSGLIHVQAYDKLTGVASEITLKPLSTKEVMSSLDDLEMTNNDIEILRQIEINDLIQRAKTYLFSLSDDEYYEMCSSVLESVKNDLDKLRIFVYSLENE